jgi:hypothetical protein
MPAKVNTKKPGSVGKRGANLEAECARLRAQVEQLAAERDGYLKSLYALTRKSFQEPVFDAEELSTMGEMDVSAIIHDTDSKQKDDPRPKARMPRSKSAGRRRIAKS